MHMRRDANPYQPPHTECNTDMANTDRRGFTEAPEPPPAVDLQYVPFRFYALLAMGLIIGWLALAVHYPITWAVLSAALLILGFGLLTTKVIIRFENPKLMWCWTPVFGLGWLLFFWCMFQIMS